MNLIDARRLAIPLELLDGSSGTYPIPGAVCERFRASPQRPFFWEFKLMRVTQ